VDALSFLFAEEVGLVLEVAAGRGAAAVARLAAAGVAAAVVGATLEAQDVSISVAGVPALAKTSMTALRDVWESTSFALERLQANPVCVAAEQAALPARRRPAYALTFAAAPTPRELLMREPAAKPRVAVIREEGSNGDREMTAALWSAGFDAWDVTMSDLLEGRAVLDGFRGVVFPGGFSYADVLDSAKGWAGTIKFSPRVLAQFSAFYARSDTFSLGVCNGCQLMALLGWVPFGPGVVPVAQQPRFVKNASGRFESRFSTVRIAPSPAVLFRGMAGSVLGVWVSHGEGRAHFPDASRAAAAAATAPLHYVDEAGAPTEAYPANPNGSPHGIAGLCSADGRHLAVMPHPERTVRTWQAAWAPEEWRARERAPGASTEGPWARMFQNAAAFCEEGGA
jgi:phosphoribosylformylglycinamidine synthase